jgi:hypothetical protein
VSEDDDEMPLGVEASINLDAFDPEDLDDEELIEGADILSAASAVSSAFYSTVREVRKNFYRLLLTLRGVSP